MGLINQLYYAVKRVIIDGKTLFVRLFSFIFMIGLLGAVFSSSFEASSIDNIEVVYYSEDKGLAGEEFLSTLLNIDSIKSMVEFKEVKSFDEGKEYVNDKNAGAFIYVPEGFSDNLAIKDEQASVEVYCQKYSGINKTIIQCIMDSYVNAMNTAFFVQDINGNFVDYDISLDSNIDNVPVSKEHQMSSFQYYAVAMVLLLILYGAEYGCYGMSEDVVGALGERIKVSPLNVFQQYVGKLIGFSLATFIQAIIIIVITIFGFNVSWGNNTIALLFIIFTFSLLSNILGIMLITLTKDLKKAGPLVFVFAFLFTFLAGGFVATDFNGLEKISPSYYAKTAIFNVIYDGSTSITIANIAIMWGIIILLSFVSILAARRKRA